MIELQVVAKHFPAAKYNSVKALNDEVLKLQPLHDKVYGDVRNYFGEQVAFFFRYLGFFINSLVFLSLFAIIASVAQISQVIQKFENQNWAKIAFGVVVVGWASICRRSFEHKTREESARWGMEHNRAVEFLKKEHMQKIELWRSAVGNLVMLLFLLAFIATITWITFSMHDSRMRSYATTGTTLAFSAIWGQLAIKLVELENHKQKRLKTESLILKLGFVKIFLFLFPLCRVAFLMQLSKLQCGSNVHEIWKEYHQDVIFNNMQHKNIDYDDHLFKSWMQFNELKNEGITRSVLGVMTDFGMARQIPRDQTCYMGCKPVVCDLASNGELSCLTTCYYELLSSLTSLFISHVVFTAAFILIGIVKVVRKVRQEMADSGNGKYSFLQFQEKCKDAAPYKYLSWGGSYVEDFLEVILAFALIASFGIICPPLACIALVTHAIENRLLLWRTANITCRPFPEVSQGIGAWNTILEIVVSIALLINGALVISIMRTPMERWCAEDKFCVFAIWTMTSMFFRVVMRALLPETSADFLSAEKTNTLFLQKFRGWWHANKLSNLAP